MPRIKRIYVAGLTVGELSNLLNEEYLPFVKSPETNIVIIKYRPVKIYIDGEVENPGLHVLAGSSSPAGTIENFRLSLDNNVLTNKPSSSEDQSIQNNVFFPSIIDALRISGGLTMFADLRNIKVTRINNISSGGGRIATEVNLISALDLKDYSQNIRVLDGDTIFISKSLEATSSQIAKVMKSNINPKFIQVVVGGRVERPGNLKLSKSATLNEAIEYSGGTKVLKGPVRFLRYNNDGTTDRRKFRLQKSAKRGSYKNPYLKQGDVIVVGKGALNVTAEVLGEITAPLQSVVTSYGFYKILQD